jgi:hypothetical protein
MAYDATSWLGSAVGSPLGLPGRRGTFAKGRTLRREDAHPEEAKLSECF